MLIRFSASFAGLIFLAGCASTPDEISTQRTGSSVERVSPIQAAEVNTRLGVGYLEQGQLQIAMDKLEQAVRLDPNHAPALLALGIVYERIGNVDMALEYVNRAVKLAPDDGSVHNSYATLLCRAGRYEEADEHFMQALEDPFYSTPEVILANAGSCARRAKEFDSAERYLRETLIIDPNNQIALFNLAGLFYEQGEHLRARAFLQRLESQEPVLDPESLLLGFRNENALGSSAEAQRYATTLENYYPNTPQASFLRQQQIDD